MKIVIFTDLDGTLLNHEDYSFDDARPSLDRIKRNGIPLVITTSKTRVEVEEIQREMDIQAPFIVENGAAVFFPLGFRGLDTSRCEISPPYAMIKLGISYGKIREFIEKTRSLFGIRSFGDLSVSQIAELAGMSLEKAAMAKEREFTEPFLLDNITDLQAFQRLALAQGMKVIKGGRFFHLVGIQQDKGRAIRIAKSLLSDNQGIPVKTIGLGDSPNDVPMLKEVDIPVLIPRPDGTYEEINLPGLTRAIYPGSRGWHKSMEQLLDKMKF